MNRPLRIAAAQFPVSGNIDRNARYIRAQIVEAASKGGQVIQFLETALSGYGPTHFDSLANYAWQSLDTHTQTICELASSHNIWVVLGTMRQDGRKPPKICLQIISNTGAIVGFYDKRHVTSLVIDDYPSAELGWTYDNRGA